MTPSSPYVIRFKWGALAVTAITFLALMPQLHFWLLRGEQWQGAYTTLQHDELLYSAYVNALIDGRPRRNDPFTGRDDESATPLPETAFSIQVVPPFIISSLAKGFGVTSSTAFIILAVVAGLLASSSVFWILISITRDVRLAAVGVIFVLSFGGLVAGHGLVGLLLNRERLTLGLPFLRRYQPAASFYLFFVFCTLIWRGFTTKSRRIARVHAVLAGLTLGVLIFSYLYLWTAAVVWLGCVTLLWQLQRPAEERQHGIDVLMITVAITLFALVPYVYLVSHRARALDELQTVISTHHPDLFRMPEIIGALIIIVLFTNMRRGKVQKGEPRVIFAAAFALLPIVVFNQQILTGRSMQPFHFEDFVCNYVVLVSLVIVASLQRQSIPRRSLLWIAAFCFLWGMTEVSLATQAFYRRDVVKDQIIPVLLRLKELSKEDPATAGSKLVFSPHIEVMQLLPTWAPQGTLLGIGAVDFGSASHQERKEFLNAYLYYSGANADRLRELFDGQPDEMAMSDYVKIAVFGHERVTPGLSFEFKPIRQVEIEEEVSKFQVYITLFSRDDVLRHPLAYLVTLSGSEAGLPRVDQWYERDAGERVGAYTLYRLKPRQ